MDRTISRVVTDEKCCSCGICAGCCPRKSISMSLIKGIPTPLVDDKTCIKCGICLDVCPGESRIEEYLNINSNELRNYIVGNVLLSETCQVMDENQLKRSASGGLVTKLVSELLENPKNGYDCAFVIKSHSYDNLVESCVTCKSAELCGSEKSRYVSVSHEIAARYILSHRSQRVILIGTSCAIQGFTNVIKRFDLTKNNYLLIGLFCDKLMTYRVWEYYQVMYGKTAWGGVKSLYFKDKELKGWPGDMKLIFEDNILWVPKKIRIQAKDFFCHPGCMFCIDKLNGNADISVGDNYTGEHSDKKGSSCVIVRTPDGMKAYKTLDGASYHYAVGIDKITSSQEIGSKKENLSFIKYKYIGTKIPDFKLFLKYHYKLFKIKCGEKFYRRKYPLKLLMQLDESLH